MRIFPIIIVEWFDMAVADNGYLTRTFQILHLINKFIVSIVPLSGNYVMRAQLFGGHLHPLLASVSHHVWLTSLLPEHV